MGNSVRVGRSPCVSHAFLMRCTPPSIIKTNTGIRHDFPTHIGIKVDVLVSSMRLNAGRTATFKDLERFFSSTSSAVSAPNIFQSRVTEYDVGTKYVASRMLFEGTIMAELYGKMHGRIVMNLRQIKCYSGRCSATRPTVLTALNVTFCNAFVHAYLASERLKSQMSAQKE